MGFSHATYAAFGVHIPREQYQAGGEQYRETQWLDGVIRNDGMLSEVVGYLTVGDYDRDELFLVIREPDGGLEVELGTFRQPPLVAPLDWTLRLLRLAKAAGYDESRLTPPSWIVVPDVS